MRKNLADALMLAANAPGTGLAAAALVIARIEFPKLDPDVYLARLDDMGAAARLAVARAGEGGDSSSRSSIRALNHLLFEELGFVGNRTDDPRNSCLNEVLDRRTGIPITMSVVYMEVARRAGLQIDGINFPGHFLARCHDPVRARRGDLIIDPYNGGAILSEHSCRALLQQVAGPDVPFRTSLLAPAPRVQIIVRMLINLKQLYVHMRSFPQAREVTEMLLVMMPSARSELRDRGLLLYHLNDVTGALRDLQTYLQLARMGEMDEQEREDHQQIAEHVKTLRRRVAALN